MINDATKKELLAEATAKVFCNVLTLTIGETVYRYVDNNEAVIIGGEGYEAKGFDFTSPDPNSDDAAATVTIEDVDRILMQALQEVGDDTVAATIGLIRYDDPDTWVDGPYAYKLDSMSASGDGSIKLNLTKQSNLGYSASSRYYSATEFPGLFG